MDLFPGAAGGGERKGRELVGHLEVRRREGEAEGTIATTERIEVEGGFSFQDHLRDNPTNAVLPPMWSHISPLAIRTRFKYFSGDKPISQAFSRKKVLKTDGVKVGTLLYSLQQ